MTAEVLGQLKVLRGGLADTVQGDPRYLTLNALDKSVAEIGAVASATPGEAGAIPTQVLGQLKTIRDGIADGLRNDHRYLTLSALDKSIAEIGGMLAAAGLIDPEHATPMAPVHFEPGAPAVASAPVVPAPAAPPATSPAPAAAPVAPAAEASPPKKSKSKPILETAAVVAAGMLAAEVIGAETKPAALAKSKPKPAEASEEDDTTSEKKEAAGDEAGADEAEEHGDEAGEAKSEKTDDADDAADADEAKDHGGEADEADEAKAEKTDDGDDAEKHDEAAGDETHAEAQDHGDEADEAKAGEIEASDSGDAADKDEPKKTDNGDAMPDAAGIVPAGKASGYVPMAAKAGAAQYQPGVSVKFGKLPNKVDLRSLMTPIEDQGDTSSCVANAVAGAYEYWVKKASKQDTNISRLFVYYNARWRGGSQDKDDGSVIQLAMEGLSKFGACPEHVWPFDPRLVLKKPGAEAYKDAAPFRVQDMAQVPLKLEAWKQALAEGKPIVFGIALFDSFDECSKRGGVVPMPTPDDVARAKHSGHSMCAVGYSDTEKVFIVRNSWGPDWGDKGYCYMPYDYLLNEKFNDGDNWVFVPKVPMQPPREVWSNTTEPVTNSGQGVDFPITTYTITDYTNIAVDLFEHVRKPFNATILEDYGQYVSWASKSMWTEFASFDFTTFLATTAALTGVASLATDYLSETSETSETSESSEESSESSESEDSEAESSEEADETETEDASKDDDSSETSEEDDDADETDEAAGDEASEGDDNADDAESDDAKSDDDAGGGNEDSEDDESEGDGESEGDDDAEDKEKSEGEDDDEKEDDDSDEDDGGDDDGGEGEGDDEGGDDDE